MTFSQTANAMNNVTIKQAHDAARLLWGAISSEDDKYEDALNLLQYFINQHPTPVQGEPLPVLGDSYSFMPPAPSNVGLPHRRIWVQGVNVTDHAQATAEIAELKLMLAAQTEEWRKA